MSGVHDVPNDIEVKVPGHVAHSDTDIALAVRTALEWRSFIPSDRIKTSVTRGVVTLYGTVDSWGQVADTESVAGHLAEREAVLRAARFTRFLVNTLPDRRIETDGYHADSRPRRVGSVRQP